MYIYIYIYIYYTCIVMYTRPKPHRHGLPPQVVSSAYFVNGAGAGQSQAGYIDKAK